MLACFAKGKKGFTLIELMIVVAIIAVLAAVAIPNFMSARDRARRAAAVKSIDGIRTAMELYITDDRYPDRVSYTAVKSDLFPYSNITALEKGFVGTFALTGGAGYIITATAKDRASTPCTATESTLECIAAP